MPKISGLTRSDRPSRPCPAGLHDLALFMFAGATLLLTVTLLDRSLRTLAPSTARKA
ncbi:hypothetical protein [Streptomyces mirabilis]|uniref:hypothetical protein n=1 Tax=Streptomyces mirabilis TaxID=68239 RepID=UPI0036B7B6D6